MPTYEYRCKSCDHQFDVVQAFSDDNLTDCPECGGVLKKVFGNVGITFKGSGFYKTDSRSAGTFGSAKDADRTDAKKSTEAANSSSDSSSSASTDTTTADTKSADKKPAASTSSDKSSSGPSSPKPSAAPSKT